MSEFHDVTVVMKANVYFEGAVTSRTIKFADGSMKTLGFMQIGEYEFNTKEAEVMDILAGECSVLLAEENDWKQYAKGDAFNVPAASSFKIKALTPTDYCCSFLKK